MPGGGATRREAPALSQAMRADKPVSGGGYLKGHGLAGVHDGEGEGREGHSPEGMPGGPNPCGGAPCDA